MGPAEFPPGEGIQVRPHPHIGLATITYLFEGQIMHRDSLGYAQAIRPGAINLMTAGRGIVHSERAGDDLDETSRLHGIQSWMALPTDEEECDPAFKHFPASELPELVHDQVAIRVIIGEVWGKRSPVPSHLPMLYLECRMPAGSALTLPDNYDERAAYVVDGSIEIDGRELAGGLMAVAHPGKTVSVRATKESHVMIIGGTNPGRRHIWWNFVSSSKERIAKAKDDWRENRFEMVPGDTEFIPLPD
jgi:redox-sensitive bicupin YhaK (pirin superfamily)